MTEVPDEAWESDDCVRRTVVMPAVLAERLAARAEQRGLSISDLLTEYAEAAPAAEATPADETPAPEPVAVAAETEPQSSFVCFGAG